MNNYEAITVGGILDRSQRIISAQKQNIKELGIETTAYRNVFNLVDKLQRVPVAVRSDSDIINDIDQAKYIMKEVLERNEKCNQVQTEMDV